VSGRTAKTASRRAFDRWSRSYERDPLSRWIGNRQREALAALELGADDRLLDVGCGTGAAVRTAAQVVERAVGVDLSPMMVAEARDRAAGLEGVEFVEGDSEELPFQGGEFTAVLCSTSLHHYPRPGAAVREMARVLAPGGRAVICDATSDALFIRGLDLICRTFEEGHVRFHRLHELRRLLEEAGLERAESRSLWGGIYGIAIARKAGE